MTQVDDLLAAQAVVEASPLPRSTRVLSFWVKAHVATEFWQNRSSRVVVKVSANLNNYVNLELR